MLSLNGGQSLEDKLQAVKYIISGQGLSYVVLKATTSEVMGSKRKHLNYLVNITHEPNVSIPNLVKYLMQRTRRPEWSVVFKSLLTAHHLMNYANEKFIQNLASSTVNHRSFDRLSSFADCSSSLAHDMSTFLRRYSRYISTKIQTYRSLGFEFCQSTANSEHCQFKMKKAQAEQLSRVLLILQNQFDVLMAFDATTKDLNNGIINSAFSMLYKDFVKLYITYQSAIIRLLELYFTLSSPKYARSLLDCYKKFLVRMDKTSDFMRVVNMLAMDTSDMPALSKSPSLPLSSLEKQLQLLENKHRLHHSQGPLSGNDVSLVEPPPRIKYTTLERRRDSQGSRRSFIRSSPSAVRSRKRPATELLNGSHSFAADEKRRGCDSSTTSEKSVHQAHEAQQQQQAHLESGKTRPESIYELLFSPEVPTAPPKEEADLMVLDEEPTSGQADPKQQLSQQPDKIVRTTPLDWIQVEL